MISKRLIIDYLNFTPESNSVEANLGMQLNENMIDNIYTDGNLIEVHLLYGGIKEKIRLTAVEIISFVYEKQKDIIRNNNLFS